MFKNDSPSGLFDQSKGGDNIPPFILKEDNDEATKFIILKDNEISISDPDSDSESIVDFLYPVQILQQAQDKYSAIFQKDFDNLFIITFEKLKEFIKENIQNKSLTNKEDQNKFNKKENLTADLSTIVKTLPKGGFPQQPDQQVDEAKTWLLIALKTAGAKDEVTKLQELVSPSKT